MRVLLVHPSPLLFSEIYLRLEPLGVERVGTALAAAGHEVRLLDLQVWRHGDYRRALRTWRPEVIGFSLNYLANVPEVVDLARAAKDVLPDCRVLVGGHSASFVAAELLAHADGAIDCVVRGEGEVVAPRVLEAFAGGPPLASLPGVVTADGGGAPPLLVLDLAAHPPARQLARRRRRYFIGELDPCASIEFTRGCPWDCAFCSAWTFYGRSYRMLSARGSGRGPGPHPRAERLHRRRRRLHSPRARARDRGRGRAARHPQALLPRDARRRPAPQPRGLRALDPARAPLHVPRHRGDRRGGAPPPPEAGARRPEHARPRGRA